MKSKRIIIILMITNIILIGIIYNFIIKNGNIQKETEMLKEMSESTQVIDLNNQINALNTEHTEYINYIQTCKTKIATALTNEGVETSDQILLEEMAEKIPNILQARTSDATATADNITEGKTAYVNGIKITGTGADNNAYYESGKYQKTLLTQITQSDTYTSTSTFNSVKTYDCSSIENYQNLTEENFAIEPVSFFGGDGVRVAYTRINSVLLTYNSETGIVTITTSISVTTGSTGGYGYSYKLYLYQ